MSFSFTPKATKTNKMVCSDFVLQTATEDCCTMPAPNLLLPIYPVSLLSHNNQTGICESFVCWLGTEIKPFGSQ